jgi:RHS repeat-associated protein
MLACVAVCGIVVTADAAERLSLEARPLLAGRASLTADGFVEARTLGTANFTPELRWPVQLMYESASEKTGLFGFAWRSPQLESSAAWDKDGVLWTAPWGERIKFRPKRERLPKDAVKVELWEEARRGRGFWTPYADWEADTSASDFRKTGDWIFSGKRACAGWTFRYRAGRLARVEAPSGRALDFGYAKDGRLLSVSQDGAAFVEIVHNADGLAESVRVNGVETRLAYERGQLRVLPKTPDGQVVPAVRPRLSSLRTADLDPVLLSYAGNYLSRISQGAHVEELKVQEETLEDRRRNLRSALPKSKVEHTGRIAGRLLSDGVRSYAYGKRTGTVTLRDGARRTAEFDFNAKTGVFGVTEFSGRKYTVYYFMRYDVAYLGKVRKVVDGKGRDVVSFRYDKATSRATRVRDRLGNDRNFEYDGAGHLVRETRRSADSSDAEPVRAFACDKAGNPASVSQLDADGRAVRTVTVAYDGEGRPVRLSDGRREAKVAYTKWGRPASVTDELGRTAAFEYDRWNRPVRAADADGVVTTCAYTPAGQVARMERRAGEELAQSVEVAYDGAGRPVSYTDQDGRARKFERDAFGRVVKEIFPDATEVGYAYDGAGRLSSVLDENRHRIQFGWDAFGLASRATAAGQVTDYVRDDYGLLKEVVSSRGGRAERTVRREYDRFDRPVKVVYGPGEVETFAYDAWGRLAKHTRGKKAETYAYDHFGRLVEKAEDGVTTSYAYDAWGQRTRRVTKDAEGKVVSEETRAYDKFGRLSEIASGGKSVRYAYDRAGRVARQVVDGRTISFEYTRYGRLAAKTLLGADGKTAEMRYRYGKDGKIASRRANGVLQNYAYDAKGQLVAVTGEDGTVAERYVYDPAGNILEKEVGGRVTKYVYDGANQLVSSTAPDGTVTKYAYDAAGRMVREGTKTYRYGYLDKVLSVADGGVRRTFTYHVDGQLATATRTGGSRSRTTETGRAASPLSAAETESFLWDGLALIQRGSTSYVNEPHPNGGSPVLSSSDGVMFNDVLGTTLGTDGDGGYAAASLTAFGDPVPRWPRLSRAGAASPDALFTGKPHVDGLGYAFLFRNYRPGLGKWQTADPLGYPDGWNQLAYCNNDAENSIDLLGCLTKRGSLKFNSKRIQRFVGYQPGSTLSHQIAIYETVTVYDKFEATISYTRVNSHGIADIAVGQITGEWSIYDSIFVNQDNDGMACQTGFSFLFLNFGTRYFSTYADPVIYRSADNKFVSYTYTFNVYSTSYVGADIQIGYVGIDTGINANLPDLRYYGSFNIVLTNQVE